MTPKEVTCIAAFYKSCERHACVFRVLTNCHYPLKLTSRKVSWFFLKHNFVYFQTHSFEHSVPGRNIPRQLSSEVNYLVLCTKSPWSVPSFFSNSGFTPFIPTHQSYWMTFSFPIKFYFHAYNLCSQYNSALNTFLSTYLYQNPGRASVH